MTRLQVHLENLNSVKYNVYDDLTQKVEQSEKTMLTEYFATVRAELKKPLKLEKILKKDGSLNPRAPDLTYLNFPKYYTWDKDNKTWNKLLT